MTIIIDVLFMMMVTITILTPKMKYDYANSDNDDDDDDHCDNDVYVQSELRVQTIKGLCTKIALTRWG